MIKARMMATAMLFNGSDMLMMKRSLNRTLSPGLWAAVGGHLEPHEIGDPKAACLREIAEETGLEPDQLLHLKLQYILLRLNQNEVRQQFIYTGETTSRTLSQTDEGELFWIPREQVLDREIPFIFRSLLEHYFANGPSAHVWVGTAGFTDAGEPAVHWTELIDPQRV
ncbi:NUDIX domain-containing protein [Paenibacillus thalictri]|uniref:NUDIX domain-containing protein n=1 Tax=Paenibacillus thalictri TaxID=2527873 RepID=A0A4Q9DWZ2_9BACL|nr:NUDIX domain-containing protein [Paenibacillus thalictri]TBL81617.1 NUDIX domain-containing protein [Paenibacillus thalictri]